MQWRIQVPKDKQQIKEEEWPNGTPRKKIEGRMGDSTGG
jgi:hypothetical protein